MGILKDAYDMYVNKESFIKEHGRNPELKDVLPGAKTESDKRLEEKQSKARCYQ